MGILNITPDSFSDGGRYFSVESALNQALSLIKDGADIIDIGVESTRPGAKPLSLEDELDRVIPVIRAIREKESNRLISIDTTKSIVAEKAIEAGADIVNDISGLTMDDEMSSVVAKLDVPVILMHRLGSSETMQQNPVYNDIIQSIIDFFNQQIHLALSCGIAKNKIILDPGIGFGKTVDHNFTLIRKLDKFCELGYPILIGPSRKAFIGATLDLPPEDRKEGTSAAVSAGILNGARIVRVHDVKEMKRVVTITEKIRTAA